MPQQAQIRQQMNQYSLIRVLEVLWIERKIFCWGEELLEGEKGRDITHPLSHILPVRVLDLQPQKLQD